MQQKFQNLRTAFASGPEAGAQAWQQLQDLCKEGYLPAQLFVASQKLKAPPPLYDLPGALELLTSLKDATEQSGADRQLRSTALYRLGEALTCHFPDRMTEAYEYLAEAARLGQVEAQLSVAYCLRKGLGVASDTQAAIQYLREAAKQGHPRAFYELGVLLAQTDGNAREAMAALQRAASFNYPAAGAMAFQLGKFGNLTQAETQRKTFCTEPNIEHITALLDPMECSQ